MQKMDRSVSMEAVFALKGTDHRVLFQNAKGDINMGVWFNDPDVKMEDIMWYQHLGKTMHSSLGLDEGLMSTDDKLGTISCYVVLHRNDKIRCLFSGL